MLDELREVKYFQEITDFKSVIMYRNKMFEESSKSRGVCRTQGNIDDGAFLWIYLTVYDFCNKSSIIDV